MHLELHFTLSDASTPAAGVLRTVWDTADGACAGAKALRMSDALLYYYHVFHAAYHIRRGNCGVRTVMDIWILNHRTDHDPEARRALLRQGGLERFADALEAVAEAWFSGAPPEARCEALESFLFVGGVYRGEHNYAAEQARSGGRLRYVLGRAFTALDDAHGTLQTESDGRGYFLVSDEGYTWYSLKVEPGYERGEDFAILQGDTALEWQKERPGVTRMQKFLKAPSLLRSDGDYTEMLYFRVAADDQTELTITGIEQTQTEPAATVKGAQAGLNGTLALRFTFTIPEELVTPGAYAEIRSGEKVQQIPFTEASKVVGSDYSFEYRFPAKNYRDKVNVKLYDGDGQPIMLLGGSGKDYTQSGLDYSLRTYVEKSLAKPNASPELLKLVRAIDAYCTAAQIYFGYEAEGLSVSEAVSGVDASMLADYAGVFEGTKPAGVQQCLLQLQLVSDTTLRLNVETTAANDGYVFKIDGRTVHPERGADGMYSLDVPNISARNLDVVHTFSVSLDGVTYTVKVSALTFARASIRNGSENRQNLGRAIYMYNIAAEEYFAAQS